MSVDYGTGSVSWKQHLFKFWCRINILLVRQSENVFALILLFLADRFEYVSLLIARNFPVCIIYKYESLFFFLLFYNLGKLRSHIISVTQLNNLHKLKANVTSLPYFFALQTLICALIDTDMGSTEFWDLEESKNIMRKIINHYFTITVVFQIGHLPHMG